MTPEERVEQLARIDWIDYHLRGPLASAIREAEEEAERRGREQEREACAKMVESAPMGARPGAHHLFAELCELAATIRARSQEVS